MKRDITKEHKQYKEIRKRLLKNINPVSLIGKGRDPKRIGLILKYIQYYWKKNPDLRLCQLIVNIAQYYQAEKPRDVYYVEDKVLLDLLKKLCKDDLIKDALRKRKATEKIERWALDHIS